MPSHLATSNQYDDTAYGGAVIAKKAKRWHHLVMIYCKQHCGACCRLLKLTRFTYSRSQSLATRSHLRLGTRFDDYCWVERIVQAPLQLTGPQTNEKWTMWHNKAIQRHTRRRPSRIHQAGRGLVESPSGKLNTKRFELFSNIIWHYSKKAENGQTDTQR